MIPYADPSLNRKSARAGSAARTFSSIVAWSFGAIMFFGAIAGLVALLIHPYANYFVLGAAGLILAVAGNSARRTRRRRSRMVLTYLAQSLGLNLPMSSFLLVAAQSEKPAAARRLNFLRTALEDGSPIGDAIAFAVPHASQRVVDLANAAERNGRLPDALAQLLDHHYPTRRMHTAMGFYPAYALILLLMVSGLVTLLTIFVMPRFESLLRDFKVPPPFAMHATIALGQSLLPVVFVIAGIATLIAEGRALRQILSPGRPRVNPLTGVLDRLLWITPIFGSIARDRGLADVCSIIADSLRASRPLDQAIGEAVQPHLNAVLRGRIDTWSTLAASGTPIAEAAASAGLPPLLCGFIGPAARAGNLSDAFRFLARHYESAFSRAALLLEGAAIPALVLSLGFIVLGVALAMFEPIVLLIQRAEIQTRLW